MTLQEIVAEMAGMSEDTAVYDAPPEDDGPVIDPATGEVLIEDEADTGEFCIDSLERLDWLATRLGKLEAAQQSLAAEVVGAKDRAARATAQLQRKADWLRARYMPQAELLVRGLTTDKAGKVHGLIRVAGEWKFSTTGGAVKVKDGLMDAAVAWAAYCAPEAIIRPEPRLSMTLVKKHADLPPAFFETTERVQVLTVKFAPKGGHDAE